MYLPPFALKWLPLFTKYTFENNENNNNNKVVNKFDVNKPLCMDLEFLVHVRLIRLTLIKYILFEGNLIECYQFRLSHVTARIFVRLCRQRKQLKQKDHLKVFGLHFI
jgi:hypothetical protein